MRGKGEDEDAGRQNYKDPARFSWKLAYEVLVAGNMQRVLGRLSKFLFYEICFSGAQRGSVEFRRAVGIGGRRARKPPLRRG